MTSLSAVLLAIEAALAVNHGTGMDLSAEGAVLPGRFTSPPRLPFACRGSPPIKSTQGPPMSMYTRACVVDVFAWGQCSSPGNLAVRTRETEALSHALLDAIEDARGTPGNALYGLRTFSVDVVSLDSDADPVPDGGTSCWLQVEFTFARATGTSS